MFSRRPPTRPRMSTSSSSLVDGSRLEMESLWGTKGEVGRDDRLEVEAIGDRGSPGAFEAAVSGRPF